LKAARYGVISQTVNSDQSIAAAQHYAHWQRLEPDISWIANNVRTTVPYRRDLLFRCFAGYFDSEIVRRARRVVM